MKKLGQEFLNFINCKIYIIVVGFVAMCSYGFAIVYPSIGMDDTAVPLYFDEGVAPYVGRWSLFVINKVFRMHISGFVPWMMELISVVILVMSVTLWCVLWRRLCEPKVCLPVWSYLFIACVFISCPLISEVFVFYLHNGICSGYGLTAISLICFLNSLSVEYDRRKKAGNLALSAVFLSIALGLYESFIIVYIMGAVMAFFLLRRLYGKGGRQETVYELHVIPWVKNGILAVAATLLMRMVVLAVLRVIYDLERLERYNVLYRHLFGDNFRVEGELVMNIKRFWVMYYVNAIVYLPIAVLVFSFAVIGIYSLYHGVKKKDAMLPFCSIVMVLLPVLMSIVEGIATHYRSSQYVPLVGAFAVLLLSIEFMERRAAGWLRSIACFLLAILIYNQCADMNKWFYIDYLKYQDAVRVMEQVAYDLKTGYDVSKPLIIKGGYRVPYEISKEAYCAFSSPRYRWICLLTDFIDPHLKEKYYAENGQGYIFAEAPIISVLQWGTTAFDGTCGQLIEFWKMHGYSFRCVTDLGVIEEADQIRRTENMPGYPESGYIREEEDYILINLESIS